jgi:hypothetical protein
MSNEIPRRIHQPSENLMALREVIAHARATGKSIDANTQKALDRGLIRQDLSKIPEEKEISEEKRQETFRFMMARFGILTRACPAGSESEQCLFEEGFIDKVLEHYDIEYFYAKEGISRAGLTEKDKDPGSNDTTPFTTDENGHNPHHVYILKDKKNGVKFFFGPDDLETLFKDKNHLIERAIVFHLQEQRQRGVKFHKSRLNQLEKVLLISTKSTEPKKSEFKKTIDELKKIKNDYFTDTDFEKSDKLIADFSTVWDTHWTNAGKDDAWLEDHNLDHFLTAMKEINRNNVRKNPDVLSLLNPDTATIQKELNTSFAFIRLGPLGEPNELSDKAVELITSTFNKLRNEQTLCHIGEENVNGEDGKSSAATAKHPLATVKGQASLYVAEALIKASPAPKVLNVSLATPGPLSAILKDLTGGDAVTVTDICTRKDEHTPAETFDVVVANHIFHKMTGKKEEVINNLIEIRKAMTKDSTLMVTMPQQHQMAKSKFGEIFTRAGFKLEHPPEIERNTPTPAYHELTANNAAAKGIVNKAFEVCTLRLDTELSEKQIRENLNGLPGNFFETKNPAQNGTYGSREILPEYILRIDYLKALAVLNASAIAQEFIATDSRPVTRANIIQNHEAQFEESLAALQYFSTTDHGGIDLLTEFQKDKLAGVIHAYDERFLPTLSSTQVDFVQRSAHLITTEIEDLPPHLHGILRSGSSSQGDRCTLWDAYQAEKAHRSSPPQTSVLNQIRPRQTLAEKVKYAFEKRLEIYKNYDRGELPEIIHNLNPKDRSKMVSIGELPTGRVQVIPNSIPDAEIALSFLGLDKSGICSTLVIDKDRNSSAYVFPSQLVKNNELSSYFKNDGTDQFTIRLNAFKSNTNFTNQMLAGTEIPIERINGLISGQLEPFRAEVEILAHRFYVTPVVLDPLYEYRENKPEPTPLPPTPKPQLLLLGPKTLLGLPFHKLTSVSNTTDQTPPVDPTSSTTTKVNTTPITLKCPLSEIEITVEPNEDGSFKRKDISDFVEESLAALEFATQNKHLEDEIVTGRCIQIIKALWDEKFVLSLNRDQLDYLTTILQSNIRSNRSVTIESLSKRTHDRRGSLIKKFRTLLSERIANVISKKRIDATSGLGNSDLNDITAALSRIGKLPAHVSTGNKSKSLYSKIAEFNRTHLIAPRRLLTPEHVTQLFTDKTPVGERINCLSNNENYSHIGLKHFFIDFLKTTYNMPQQTTEDTYTIVDSVCNGINLLELQRPTVFLLSRFFGVHPTDIDPTDLNPLTDFPVFATPPAGPPPPPANPTPPSAPTPPATGSVNFAALGAVSKEELVALLNSRDSYKPLDFASIDERIELYRKLPGNHTGRRDINEAVLVELALGFVEKHLENQGRTIPEINALYLSIMESWDLKLDLTLSTENKEKLIQLLTEKIPTSHKVTITESVDVMGEITKNSITSIEQHGSSSLVFKRSNLATRLDFTIQAHLGQIGDDLTIDPNKYLKGHPFYELFEYTIPANSPPLSNHSLISVSGDPRSLGHTVHTVPAVVIPHNELTLRYNLLHSARERVLAHCANNNVTPFGLYNQIITKHPEAQTQVPTLKEDIEKIFDGSFDCKRPSLTISAICVLFGIEGTAFLPECDLLEANKSSTTSATPSPSPSPLEAQNKKDTDLIAKETRNFRPLDSMSLADRVNLYKTLPADVERRDLNETILVEIYLYLFEGFYLSRPSIKQDIKDKYKRVRKAWDSDFSITLSKERRDEVLEVLDSAVGQAANTIENQRTNPSMLFLRVPLSERIATEIQKRSSKIDFATFEFPASVSELIEQTGFGCGNKRPPATPGSNLNKAFLVVNKDKKGDIIDLAEVVSYQHLAKLFTPLVSPTERVRALITNSNIDYKSNETNKDPELRTVKKICDDSSYRPTPDEVRQVADIFIIAPEDLGFNLNQSISKSAAAKPAVPASDPKPARVIPKTISQILDETSFRIPDEFNPLFVELAKIVKNGLGSKKLTLEQANGILNASREGAKAIANYLQETLGFQRSRSTSNSGEIFTAIKDHLIK